MADVTGRISSLPGAIHKMPDGQMCDVHSDRPAVVRMQGETDSFGAELNDLCQECLDEMRAYEKLPEANSGKCDWCKLECQGLRDTRDYEEGLYGPVYRVCDACIKRRDEFDADDLADYDF